MLDYFSDREIRFALVDGHIEPPCAKFLALPHPNCTDLSFYVNMSLLWGRIMFGSQQRYRIVNASQWNFQSSSRFDANDSSVFGLIERGEADFGPPETALLIERVERLHYTNYIQHFVPCFVHLALDEKPQTLTVDNLLWSQRGVWALISFCLALRLIVHRLLSPFSLLYQGERFSWDFQVRLIHLRDRLSICVTFFYGLGLSLLARYLFALFASVSGKKQDFRTAYDIIAAVKAGTHVLVADSDSWSTILQRAYQGGDPQEVRDVLHQTPILIRDSLQGLLAQFALDAAGGKPRHILVTGETQPTYRQLLAEHCGFVSYCNRDESHSTPMVTYFSPDFRDVFVKSNDAMVFQLLLQRYLLDRFPKLWCTAEADHSIQRSTSVPWPLSVAQIEGLLFCLAAALSLSAAVFGFEQVAKRLGWRQPEVVRRRRSLLNRLQGIADPGLNTRFERPL